MTELEFNNQQGNETEHGHTPIQLFGMAMEAITG